ncbi:MAG: nucleotide sugar dehydrogenase [Actinomycetota bacterium]|nr:nucleotide sugar dehydrogenase [Actinomycetota bacterium]
MIRQEAASQAITTHDADVLHLAADFGDLAIRILTTRCTVAVVGLGYVGLPLLMSAARAGFPVIGFDVDARKIERLRAADSYIPDVDVEDLARLDPERFGNDPGVLPDAEVIVLCVPTPLNDREPDLSLVRRATELVAQHLRPGQLVILESTTYPGTTEDMVRPILETSGLHVGVDFALGYSPERIDPGQRVNRLTNTPKIVSGITPTCRELAAAFYGRIAGEIVRAASPREAEMAKLIENTFRQVNIALVNELAMHARDLGVDIWESIDLASTKPFGYMPFWPGPGVGGHCIAIDPSYLSWRVGQKVGYGVDFIEHANEVNRKMPRYVVSRIGEALNEVGKPVKGSRILVLGVAYKAGVNDDRESPSLEVLELLKEKGAQVSYHDPFVGEAVIGGERLRSVPLSDMLIEEQDVVAILTAHSGIDHRRVVDIASLVFDARGVTKPLQRPNLVRL